MFQVMWKTSRSWRNTSEAAVLCGLKTVCDDAFEVVDELKEKPGTEVDAGFASYRYITPCNTEGEK